MLVHITRCSGHRASYQNLFVRLLDGVPSTGRICGARFWRLVRARRVLFATIDDDYAGFISVALFRALLRKSTTGLFLRPMQCFRTERLVVYPLKRLVFRWLRQMPRLQLLSIIPHDIRPELAEVSNGWIHDPQIWDLWVDGRPILPETKLSKQVEAARGARQVIIYVGKANILKGFDQFVSMAEQRKTDLLFVVAGQITPDCRASAARLCDLGMIVVDRYVSDDEILSLYNVAHFAWCKYQPSYDQASGVFGRAVQTGVRPVMRDGSVIEQLYDYLGDSIFESGAPMVAVSEGKASKLFEDMVARSKNVLLK